jgi:hypothetical protein
MLAPPGVAKDIAVWLMILHNVQAWVLWCVRVENHAVAQPGAGEGALQAVVRCIPVEPSHTAPMAPRPPSRRMTAFGYMMEKLLGTHEKPILIRMASRLPHRECWGGWALLLLCCCPAWQTRGSHCGSHFFFNYACLHSSCSRSYSCLFFRAGLSILRCNQL